MRAPAKINNLKIIKVDTLEQDKAEWRMRIDGDISELRNQLGFVARTISESNKKIDALIVKVDENTNLTKDVLHVAAAFRKVGMWSRFAAKFVATKAEWSLKVGRWISFRIIRPIGFAAAGFVAIWQAWVQIPWRNLGEAIQAYVRGHL